MEYLDTLSGDIKRKIALDLSPPDLICLCATKKTVMLEICESKAFWLEKLKRDYPESLLITYRDNLPLINPKKTYIRKFQEVSKVIEESSKLSGISYDVIYNVYQDLLTLRLENKGSFYDDKKVFEKYRISMGTAQLFIRALIDLIGKKLRYIQEAEEAKKYF